MNDANFFVYFYNKTIEYQPETHLSTEIFPEAVRPKRSELGVPRFSLQAAIL